MLARSLLLIRAWTRRARERGAGAAPPGASTTMVRVGLPTAVDGSFMPARVTGSEGERYCRNRRARELRPQAPRPPWLVRACRPRLTARSRQLELRDRRGAVLCRNHGCLRNHAAWGAH